MAAFRYCPYHGEYKSGYYGYPDRDCPGCDKLSALKAKIKEKEKSMAVLDSNHILPTKTKVEKFLEAAAELKEKNKKMQRAAKMLKKNPDLANLLEEISKFQF